MLLGAPCDAGQRYPGCLMGPAAYRVAGLAGALADLGHSVEDMGDVTPQQGAGTPIGAAYPSNPRLHALPEVLGWTTALAAASETAMTRGMGIFLGGDHAISLGTLAGVAAHAARIGRPLFLLWLDAHADLHDPVSTRSGNLHGTPVARALGLPGFEPFPAFPAPVPADHVCLFGLRSVDPAEHARLLDLGIEVVDMRRIDEEGVTRPLRAFLDRVRAAGGMLHVSLDVDFLDPQIAPAVGTTVPGGATFREAHLVMEMLHDSDIVAALDLVELNPFLDERGRTARLMVDLTASLMGRKVFDRRTPPLP